MLVIEYFISMTIYYFHEPKIYIKRMSYLLLAMGIDEHPLWSMRRWWCREQRIEELDSEERQYCISKRVQLAPSQLIHLA